MSGKNQELCGKCYGFHNTEDCQDGERQAHSSAPTGSPATEAQIRADERCKCAAFARAAFADTGWNSFYRQAAESIAEGLERQPEND